LNKKIFQLDSRAVNTNASVSCMNFLEESIR
jgi:hypothetical protein